MIITVKFSCDGCGLHRVDHDVPARGPDQDVIAWMDATRLLVTIEHRRRSPRCVAMAMQELMIPIAHATVIGGPSVH